MKENSFKKKYLIEKYSWRYVLHINFCFLSEEHIDEFSFDWTSRVNFASPKELKALLSFPWNLAPHIYCLTERWLHPWPTWRALHPDYLIAKSDQFSWYNTHTDSLRTTTLVPAEKVISCIGRRSSPSSLHSNLCYLWSAFSVDTT